MTSHHPSSPSYCGDSGDTGLSASGVLVDLSKFSQLSNVGKTWSRTWAQGQVL